MLSRVAGVLLGCVSFWVPALCISQTPSPLAITIGDGAVPLDGLWEFHPGDDPSWSSPTLDDSQWERLSADKPWGQQGHANYTGYAWYRRTLDLTTAPGTSTDFALFVPHIDDVYQLYWNAQLIGSKGKMPPHPIWSLTAPPQTFDLGTAHKGVLAIRVWKARYASRDTGLVGGFAAPAVIGSHGAIDAWRGNFAYEWLRNDLVTIALYLTYGFVGFLGLLAWLRDRSQWLLFWTSCFLAMPFFDIVFGNLHIPWPANLAIGVQQITDAIGNIALWYLLCWLLDLHGNRRLMRLTRIAAITLLTFGLLDSLICFFGWNAGNAHPTQIADAIFTAVLILLELYNLVPVTVAIVRKRKVDHSRWLVAATTTFAQMLYVAGLATAQGLRYTHWTISQKLTQKIFTIFGSSVTLQNVVDALTLMALLYAIYRYSMEMTSRRNTLEQEFSNAREIQQVLIPESLPDVHGYSLTSAYLPAQEVGGDFFQIIPVDTDTTLILLGDVSGKGLKAAMAVSLIIGTARAFAEVTASPAALMSRLNRRLYNRLQGGFATCIALRIDSSGNCLVASAGHPSPFVNGAELELPGACPLGLIHSVAFEETRFRLEIGDHLALYTDGLLEARNRHGELYGFDRLQTLFATKPTASDAAQHAIDFGQDDDTTVLTITRLESGARSTTRFFTRAMQLPTV
jgi:hypothetical protein